MAQRTRAGLIGGIVGGMAMGMWMMLYYWGTGRGFWSPVGYIGHFIVRNSADITAPGQVLAGGVLHMMTAMVLGAFVGAAFPSAPRVEAMTRGVAVALGVWVGMQFVVLYFFDRVAFDGIIPWAFAVGHVLYGAMLGLTLALVGERLGAGAGRST
jgi:hypothetical protein